MFFCSASGAGQGSIDNRIEQAMVSLKFLKMLRYAQWKANFNHFAAVISDKIEHTIVSYII